MAQRLLFFVLGVCWLASPPAHSQTAASGFASLKAVVTDSSARPILRIVLWNDRRTGPRTSIGYNAESDTTGVVRLDSIPAGVEQHFQLVCEQGGLKSKQLDSMTAVLAPGEVRRWFVQASPIGCDQRPFVVREGVFEGRWRYGFEESSFVPCDSRLPSAWVAFAPDAQRVTGLKWPEGLDKYYPEVFVRFQGRLVGPWRYGHMGVSDYQLTVYRTLEVRRPSDTGCGK